jgi:hypothetical protein
MRIGEYEIVHDGMCWVLRWGKTKGGKKRGPKPKRVTYWANLTQVTDAILDEEAARALPLAADLEELRLLLRERIERLADAGEEGARHGKSEIGI